MKHYKVLGKDAINVWKPFKRFLQPEKDVKMNWKPFSNFEQLLEKLESGIPLKYVHQKTFDDIETEKLIAEYLKE